MDFPLGGRVFPTKGAARTFMSRQLHERPVGDISDPELVQMLHDLLSRHPHVEEKVGCGVAGFRVTQDHPIYRNARQFSIIRIDGSKAAFSYPVCFTPRTQRGHRMMVYRSEVQRDIYEAKGAFFRRFGSVTCAETGVGLTLRDATADHRLPNTFTQIVADFEFTYGDEPVILWGAGDDCSVPTFADRKLACAFRAFHRERAELDFVTVEANRRAHLNAARSTPPHLILKDWIDAP